MFKALRGRNCILPTLCLAAGILPVCICLCQWFLFGGVSMKVVQELLGHSNFSITANVYTHVLPSMQQEAMDKMDAFFRQQS
jgi:integrase